MLGFGFASVVPSAKIMRVLVPNSRLRLENQRHPGIGHMKYGNQGKLEFLATGRMLWSQRSGSRVVRTTFGVGIQLHELRNEI